MPSAPEPEILRRNLAALSLTAPEVARWLEVSAGRADPAAEDPPPPEDEIPLHPVLARHQPQVGGISVIVGAGCLAQVRRLLQTMPPGHQVFLLEHCPDTLYRGLARWDLEPWLSQGDLVILAPGEDALEKALARHPQLALAEQVEFINLSTCNGDRRAPAAWARLYRVLGHALKARDLALRWEDPRGLNLVANLVHLALMGRAAELAGCLEGRPALVLEDGPSLDPCLEALGPHLGGAVVLASDQALPRVLEAGIIPSAAIITSPVLGRLSCYSHPHLHQVPLVAEEVAHAATLRAHPGTRLVCVGPRGTALGPFAHMAQWFTPQQHTLGRAVELALIMGCKPIVLAGADLTCPQGSLQMPAMDGSLVQADIDQAATACSLGQILARAGVTVFNTSAQGLGLPGTRLVDLDQARRLLQPCAGPPVPIPPLARPAWLQAEELEACAHHLRRAATAATRLWQRAAAPLADFPPEGDPSRWLAGADALFVALAEQAAADQMQAAFLEGCLVRAFLRRHHLVCRGHGQGVTLREACRDLNLCLADLESRAHDLARGLKDAAERFARLARARREGDRAFLAAFARRLGVVEV